MPQACTVCQHSQRSVIDEALQQGVPVRTIATEHRLSRSSLGRHRSHSDKDSAQLLAAAVKLHTQAGSLRDPAQTIPLLRDMAALLLKICQRLG